MAENEQVQDGEEQLVVVVDDEAAPQKTNGAGAQEDPVADLKEQHESLKKQVGSSNARATAAETALADAQAQLQAHGATVIDAEISKVDSALTATNAEMDAAEQALASAYETGDFKQVAKLQTTIGRLGGKAATLERDKTRLDEVKKDPSIITGRQPQQVQRQQPSDPVEAFIAGRTAPTAKWLRDHTDYITDSAKQNRLSAAHFDALANSQVPDTPAYFAHVEKFLGIGEQNVAENKPNGQQQPKQPQRQSAPVAPVGTANGTNPGGATEVRLTKGEALAATDGTHVWNYPDPTGKNRWQKGDPIGHQEYARRKREMQNTGQYDRVYIEN